MINTTLSLSQTELQTASIFYPRMMERTLAAIETNQQFVHYCDAEAAFSMIQNQEVWMRNATWMNDASEVRYGIERLFEAAKGVDGVRLRDKLEKIFPKFGTEFDDVFVPWLDDFQQETYITCFTELLKDEDLIGRLSMWRAYGQGKAAAAFVVNGGPMLRPSEALKAYSSPVEYLNEAKFNAEFKRLVDNIIGNTEFLETLGRETVFGYLFSAFRITVLCSKHPAFYEEREWRTIYQPNFDPSLRLVEDTRVVAGAPQRIFKIPLRDYPDEGFYGATLPDLLVRMIIGPGNNAESMKREFIRLLISAGVKDAHDKVVISSVPLRI